MPNVGKKYRVELTDCCVYASFEATLVKTGCDCDDPANCGDCYGVNFEWDNGVVTSGGDMELIDA